MNKAYDDEMIQKAKDLAFRYLSYRPRTVWEVKRRLAEKGYDDEIITLVADYLKEHNYIDDEAFARMWLRSRTDERPSGRRRIQAELIQKHVHREIIAQCLAEISPEREEEMAFHLAVRKCRNGSMDYKKMRGFLMRRGFNSEIIKKVLSQLAENYED